MKTWVWVLFFAALITFVVVPTVLLVYIPVDPIDTMTLFSVVLILIFVAIAIWFVVFVVNNHRKWSKSAINYKNQQARVERTMRDDAAYWDEGIKLTKDTLFLLAANKFFEIIKVELTPTPEKKALEIKDFEQRKFDFFQAQQKFEATTVANQYGMFETSNLKRMFESLMFSKDHYYIDEDVFDTMNKNVKEFSKKMSFEIETYIMEFIKPLFFDAVGMVTNNQLKLVATRMQDAFKEMQAKNEARNKEIQLRFDTQKGILDSMNNNEDMLIESDGTSTKAIEANSSTSNTTFSNTASTNKVSSKTSSTKVSTSKQVYKLTSQDKAIFNELVSVEKLILVNKKFDLVNLLIKHAKILESGNEKQIKASVAKLETILIKSLGIENQHILNWALYNTNEFLIVYNDTLSKQEETTQEMETKELLSKTQANSYGINELSSSAAFDRNNTRTNVHHSNYLNTEDSQEFSSDLLNSNNYSLNEKSLLENSLRTDSLNKYKGFRNPRVVRSARSARSIAEIMKKQDFYEVPEEDIKSMSASQKDYLGINK